MKGIYNNWWAVRYRTLDLGIINVCNGSEADISAIGQKQTLASMGELNHQPQDYEGTIII